LCIRAECRRGKAPGEPYEGKLHVRFDEGVLETEPWSGLRHRRTAKAAGQPKAPLLWPPRQRPTLQLRNVLDELPKEQHGQALNLMRAAWKVKTAEEGEKRLEQLARFLERDHESAARSLREGMKEMFTLQRLQIPASLHKCLATTNIIESPQGGVERRTHNVTRWRDADMVERWVASAWQLTEKHFRRIDGHADLWALAAILDREAKSTQPSKEKVA
jgi:hypothetical protein